MPDVTDECKRICSVLFRACKKMTADEISKYCEFSADDVADHITPLVESGDVHEIHENGETYYCHCQTPEHGS